jgi:hypothetical protein
MSEVKVNKISPRTNCGTTQLGDAGDTITVTGDLKSNSLKSASGSTITLGQSGDTIQLGCGASQTGFGRTGTVDWDTTAKTASFTAVSGNGYFVNTTSGAITVTLPAGSAGDIVSLADYAATWQTNNVTVSPNGTDKIGGVNASVTLSTEGQSVTFVYSDSTQGWLNTMDSTSNVRGSPFMIATGGTITTCGDCKIHTFTGPGTFTVTAAAVCAANNIVSHMIVAGGGGGGAGNPGAGGGGGAGGYREVKSPVTPYTASPLDGYPSAPNRVTVTATAYPITVGGGGTGGPSSAPSPADHGGTPGSDSIFSTITSAGGGSASQPPSNPGNGGSGGGGGTSGATGGSGNTPPTSPAQGTNGGTASPGVGSADASGGGGGATVAGGNGSNPGPGGPGGNGATTSISGSPTAYAGGGGGGKRQCGESTPGGTGGTGGGGDGKLGNTTGDSGTANTGGGGGAGGYYSGGAGSGGAGGSGIVIIRYKYQ